MRSDPRLLNIMNRYLNPFFFFSFFTQDDIDFEYPLATVWMDGDKISLMLMMTLVRLTQVNFAERYACELQINDILRFMPLRLSEGYRSLHVFLILDTCSSMALCSFAFQACNICSFV